ncbi:MAG: VapC toxin family PIN domain ribonuclease [Acidobacteriota bacterium]
MDYYRGRPRARRLETWLEENEVLLHPWVLGELALGHLGRRRAAVLVDLERLPVAPLVSDEEVRALVETRRLYGRGIGWVDAHLLASDSSPAPTSGVSIGVSRGSGEGKHFHLSRIRAAG